MSLTFLASSFLGNVTTKDSCSVSASSFAIIESSTPSVRILNTSTLAFILSSTTLSSPIGISMINASSAIIVSNSVNTIDLIEVATGYRQNYAGGLSTSNVKTTGGQQVAGDASTSVALAVTSGQRTMVQFNGAAGQFKVTQIVIQDDSNDVTRTVILKGPNRWLVGTAQGTLYELDSLCNVLDTFDLRLATFPLGANNPFAGSQGLPINQLAYDNNLLLVECGVAMLLIDWSTKTILKTYSPEASNTVPAIMFCNSSSGEVIVSPVTSVSTIPVYEMDMTVQPFAVRDTFLNDSTGTASQIVGMANSVAWWADGASPAKIRTYTVVPRDTTLRTIFVMTASNGVHLPAHLTLLDDTGGVGTAFTILDTQMQSPGTYRIPTGKTLIEIVKVGLGSLMQPDVTRYTT